MEREKMERENTTDEHPESFEKFSMEVSLDRVESLWRQALSQRSSSKSDLSAARASRAKAEMERQRISTVSLEATREACKELIAEAERQQVKAKQEEGEAGKKLAEAQEHMEQAHMVRAEADSYREQMKAEGDTYREEIKAEVDGYREQMKADADVYREKTMSDADTHKEKVVSEAQQESQRIREESRAAALQECDDLKRHVTYEVQCILSEIDAIRTAAGEELEAQRIYAEAATIKTMSQDVRSEIMESVERSMGEWTATHDEEMPQSEETSWRAIGVGEHYSPDQTETESEHNHVDTGSVDQVEEMAGAEKRSNNGKAALRSKA